jgi:hypothetical protein
MNITLKNWGEYGLVIQGKEESPVQNINFTNMIMIIKSIETTAFIEYAEKINYINTTINVMS